MQSSNSVIVLAALAVACLASPDGLATAQTLQADTPQREASLPAPAAAPDQSAATQQPAPSGSKPSAAKSHDAKLAKARAERCRIHPGTCVQESVPAKP